MTAQDIHVAEVNAIAAIDDPVARNEQITEAYRRLSFQLASFIGGPFANWCTYAIWSSRTIGGALNARDIPVRVQKLLDRLVPDGALRNRIEERLRASLPSTQSTYAVPLAQGNRDIFMQIGTTIARFVDELGGHITRDDEELERFLRTVAVDDHVEGIRDAPPSLFREGLACYYRARFADDTDERSELVLAGSLLIGSYEQHRVQDLVVSSFAIGIAQIMAPLRRAVGALPTKVSEPAARYVVDPLQRAALPYWSRLMTRQVMSLVVDGDPISLGEPLRAPLGSPALYPVTLQHIESPALESILERYDCADGPPQRARDWSDFDDRMRFITYFFRSRQQDGRLFGQLDPDGRW